jgi:hypothetical protein
MDRKILINAFIITTLILVSSFVTELVSADDTTFSQEEYAQRLPRHDEIDVDKIDTIPVDIFSDDSWWETLEHRTWYFLEYPFNLLYIYKIRNDEYKLISVSYSEESNSPKSVVFGQVKNGGLMFEEGSVISEEIADYSLEDLPFLKVVVSGGGTEDNNGIPGFEMIFLLIGIAFLLILKRKKSG